MQIELQHIHLYGMKMVSNDDNDDKTYCHFKATKLTRFSSDNAEHMANKKIYMYMYCDQD